jgi:hypothetical protein
MRGKTPRWALAFLVTFWAMPKSNPRSGAARTLCPLEVTRSPEGRVKALHFKNGTKVKMDSGLRRNDEQAKDEQGKGEQRTDEQVQCEEGQGEQ